MASLPKGVFSVLQDLIERAPQKMAPEQWRKYLSPGRKLEKDGMSFPLRKDELDYSSLDQLLDEAERSMSPDELAQGLQDTRTLPKFKVAQGKARVSPLSPELDKEVKALIKQWRNPEDAPLMHALNQYARGDVHSGRSLEYMGERAAKPFAAMRDIHARSAAYLDEHPIPRYPSYRTKTDAKDLESYEELMTEWPGLDFKDSHFTPSTLSHSRSSVIRAPGGRTRVIDEIQSDPHQRARDIGEYGVMPDEMSLSPEEAERLELLTERLRGRRPGEDNSDIRTIIPEYQDLRQREAALKKGSPDPMPYKDSYASLELRKNLARAAEGDEDAISIAPGRMQSSRYQMKLKPGMKRFYDQELPKELERLVRSYGGEGLENIEVPLRGRKAYTDWRPNPDKPGMMTRDLLAELRRSIHYKGSKLSPEVKQRIRKTGIPLFGASPLAVLAGEDDE